MWVDLASRLMGGGGEQELRGEARVLALADSMARAGGVTPHRLYHECVRAFTHGEIEFDEVTRLYKHAMIHAGAIVPRDRPGFGRCPVCDVEFATGGDGGATAA